MIFRELSNAAFRFSLRRPGAEIIGGVQTPHPRRRWKIQRPSRARVKAMLNYICRYIRVKLALSKINLVRTF